MAIEIFENPFVKPLDQYKRQLNFLQYYVEDTANYLSIQTGKPLDECKRFVTKSLGKGGQFQFKDPKVECLVRKENGDREKVETTLFHYLNDAIKEKEIIAPTLTTYLNPNVKTSLVSMYLSEGMARRNKAKKEMFAAEAEKNILVASVKKIEQTGRKLGNNAISGTHISPGTPLHNPTGHSSLTSTCRSTSGFGNANNEKFLSGNRHYWSHHIVLNNIVSIVTHTDYTELRQVIEKYKIHLPSVDETLECIKYSTDLYWWENTFFSKITSLVEKLNPLQRAAFVYTGDFYHLRKFNCVLVSEMVTKLSSKIELTSEDPDKVLKQADEDILNLAHQICTKETMGIGKTYDTIKGTQAHHTVACTVTNIENTLRYYNGIIKVFWVSENVPASMAQFPESIRRVVMTGDTDSTIFTTQDWVFWHTGGLKFDDNSIAVAATITYLTSATITHVLAIMSANLGVVKERLTQIKMKNEYRFDVFVPTQLGKHYYATMGCQEGNVFSKRKIEIKGVGLKSSNSPKVILNKAQAMMQDVMQTVINGEKLSLKKYLDEIATIEKEIIRSITSGETVYLRSGSIKSAQSYTKAENLSPYQNHHFWNACFGQWYGIMPDPPYGTTKVSLTTDTTVKMKKWLDECPNRQFALSMQTYMKTNDKTTITTLNVPTSILEVKGFPSEIISIIDYRKIVFDICSIFYLILETLGVYLNGDKVKRLVSEYY